MKNKKSILTMVLALCLIIPAMLIITACGGNNVDKLDGANNIVAEGKFEKGTNLLVDKVNKTNSSYFAIVDYIEDKEYDKEKVAIFSISLEKDNGTKIQPNGKVKITMPKPFESEYGYTTFHIKDNESVEELETTLNETNIVFETESFSYFIVVGKVPSAFVFSNTHEDSLQHLYNGTAVFVSKEDVTVNGTKWSEITDEEVLNKISYVWRDKNTKATVTLNDDVTLTGQINTSYGVNRDITIGNEIAGPCVVGEYEFALSYNGTEKLVVPAQITENKFEKITSITNFDSTTAPTIFGEVCYYSIVGYANGQMYVMQMPKIQDPAEPTTEEEIEAEARLISPDEDGKLVLGEEFDFVFTPMRYYENEWKYYPETSSEREDLLMDFCTGYYGARTTTINTATQVINRIGWTKLSGNQIVRVKGDYVGANYGNLTKFADDGAVTIYAPRKGETANNALRLVKDGNKFVFTGKDKTTDTRESFPIYVYKQYVKKSDSFDFDLKLDKQYDGIAVQFNCYKDLNMTTESGEDIGAMLKMETVRFVFKDLKDNIVMTGIVNQEDGTVTGPSAVGQYKLVIQFLEKGEKGNEWTDKAVLTQFQISVAS